MIPGDGKDMARHVPTDTPHKREFSKPIARSLSSIVGAYKSAVTRRINAHNDTPGAIIWQGRYHDHITRDDTDLQQHRAYSLDNPALATGYIIMRNRPDAVGDWPGGLMPRCTGVGGDSGR